MYQWFKIIISEFQNTGERPVLNKKMEEVPTDISFAYKISTKYVKNKSVLDFGCGGGYGTEYLSRFTTKEVVGFDKDIKSIKSANIFFYSTNLSFTHILPSKKFDVIVTFQVIEHIKDRNKYFKILNKLLKPNGIILFSTPNKNITSFGLKKPAMVFHKTEFNPKSLQKELSKNFNNVKIYGQISNSIKKKVIQNNYSYLDLVKSYPTRIKLTWWISQFEIVRSISRHLPMFIKYLLMGFDKTQSTINYSLVSSNILVENSFSLIALVKNKK